MLGHRIPIVHASLAQLSQSSRSHVCDASVRQINIWQLSPQLWSPSPSLLSLFMVFPVSSLFSSLPFFTLLDVLLYNHAQSLGNNNLNNNINQSFELTGAQVLILKWMFAIKRYLCVFLFILYLTKCSVWKWNQFGNYFQ